MSKYDEIQIFTGESNDFDAGMAYCYYKEQTDAGPTFLFFVDGMKEEKYWVINTSLREYCIIYSN